MIGTIIVLAFSAGCGCSTKTYLIQSNFNFSTFFLTKLMIMNIEDGNSVVNKLDTTQTQTQKDFNKNINEATIPPRKKNPKFDYQSNKHFITEKTSSLPIASNANDKESTILLLRNTWPDMFDAASKHSDIHFDPKKPYYNIYFSRFLKLYDYLNSSTIKQNQNDSQNVKHDNKTHKYKKIGNLFFGDYTNKLGKNSKKKPFTFNSETAYKANNGYFNGTKHFYPIDITISVNYKDTHNSQSKIPTGSEMDITLQFIFNTDILINELDKNGSSDLFSLNPSSHFSQLFNNLQNENENGNSPVINQYYENILQFEDITNIVLK